jgi:hypothetical protein
MVAEAIERARADEAANVGRVVEALRRMDGARSLGEVLGILAESAGQHADRAAVLLVKGDRLRAWRLAGFDVRDPIDLAVDNAGVAGSVVRTGTAATQAPADMTSMERAEQGGLPPFAEGAGARTALAVPLVVGGITVAVLYADAVSSPSSALANRWSPAVEVLCRYASRALEATTLARATGVNVPRSVAPASHGAMPGSVDPAHA